MANNYTPAFAEIVNTKLQDTLYTHNIGRQLCSTKLFTSLEGKLGGSIDRPYRSGAQNVVDYVRATDIAVADVTYVSDVLSIDNEKATEISQIDKFDKIQSVVDVMSKEAEAHGEAMAKAIDEDIFATMATDAGTTFGVTSGAWDSASTTAATVAEFDGALFNEMISRLRATLGKANAQDGKIFLAVDHDQLQVIESYLSDKGFTTADVVIKEGFAEFKGEGKYRNVHIYATNNLPVTSGVVSVVGGIIGSTDLAIQSDIEMTVRDNDKNNAKNVWVDALWGVDTPTSLKPQLVEFLVTQA